MPKIFNTAVFLLALVGAASTYGQTLIVRSEAELRNLGILVERLTNDTPMASVQIGTLVGPDKTPGEYDHTECVVLSAAVDGEQLDQADAGALEGVTVVRRNESSKKRSIFLVLGKDLPRSYIVFQFNIKEGETTKRVRYLFSIARIKHGK